MVIYKLEIGHPSGVAVSNKSGLVDVLKVTHWHPHGLVPSGHVLP